MTKTFLMAATASLFLAVAAHAQKKNEPAAGASNGDSFFSSDSRLVLIDSIVTDKKGAYIGDLTQQGFQGSRRRQRQTLTSFLDPADEWPCRTDQKNYLVLFFDNSTVPQTDQHYARDTAMKFIGTNAGRNRLMSVVEFDGSSAGHAESHGRCGSAEADRDRSEIFRRFGQRVRHPEPVRLIP